MPVREAAADPVRMPLPLRSLAALTLLLASVCGGPALAGGLVGVRALAKPADGPLAASAVKLEQTAAGAKLVFEMTAPVDAKAYVLDDPARVIVDLPETAFVLDPASGRAGTVPASGPVRSYRFGQFAPGKSRVVIDLAGPGKVVGVSSGPTPAGGAYQLKVEVAPTDAASFRTAAADARRSLAASVATPAKVDMTKPLVVLDPGHGGADTGAMTGDITEKSIVFDFAKALSERLQAGGEVRVMMTRTDDTFIPLGERVRLAEDAQASLFVSIHADTLSEPTVQGATVYTLSERASDAHAARLAENENASDRVAGIVDKNEAAGLSDILSDLTRRETKVLGRSFARGLVAAWRDVGDLNKNPLRSAGFRVLKAADFPSVLFELGYLSNAHDLKTLSSPEWRDKAVEKVASAVERFLQNQPNDGAAAMVASSHPTVTATTR